MSENTRREFLPLAAAASAAATNGRVLWDRTAEFANTWSVPRTMLGLRTRFEVPAARRTGD
jgi:hypothetical protein